MNVFRWLSNNNGRARTQNTEGRPISTDDALELSKKYDELRPYFALFTQYFRHLLDSEEEIASQIKGAQSRTKKTLLEQQLAGELRGLRYAYLHFWFFNIRPPKNQTDLEDELLTISSALKSVLTSRNKAEDLPKFKKAFDEYFSADGLTFDSANHFERNFADQLAERIPRIAFNATEGRLGGDLFDFVLELLKSTITQDKKVLELSD